MLDINGNSQNVEDNIKTDNEVNKSNFFNDESTNIYNNIHKNRQIS